MVATHLRRRGSCNGARPVVAILAADADGERVPVAAAPDLAECGQSHRPGPDPPQRRTLLGRRYPNWCDSSRLRHCENPLMARPYHHERDPSDPHGDYRRGRRGYLLATRHPWPTSFAALLPLLVVYEGGIL